MPQFQLNDNAAAAHPYYALDTFAKGYVEAMFFTNCDTGDENEDRANELGLEALTADAVAVIAKDCAAFYAANQADLDDATNRDGYSDEQAGHDFWFSRQGHGVGFGDRDALEADPETCGAYNALTQVMVDHSSDRDKWNAALDKRNALPSSVGDRLQNAARRFGECYPEFGDDGCIHVR